MEIIKDIKNVFQFDKDIYLEPPIFITGDKYWDGGIRTDSSLKEKSEFYSVAEKMLGITRDVILALKEPVFIGSLFCEYGELYAQWSDLKTHKLFQEISKTIHPKKHYKILLPEDSNVLDLIIESNFRYFSYITLYFPKSKLVLIPTCHTEILLYTRRPNEILEMLETIVSRYSGDTCRIVCKTDTGGQRDSFPSSQ